MLAPDGGFSPSKDTQVGTSPCTDSTVTALPGTTRTSVSCSPQADSRSAPALLFLSLPPALSPSVSHPRPYLHS